MRNFQANYDKILEVLNKFESKNYFIPQIRTPKLADKEQRAINLTLEYMGIDSERLLFRILLSSLNTKIERSVYNRKKRKLFAFQERIRVKLVAVLTRPKIRLHNFWSYYIYSDNILRLFYNFKYAA